MSGSEAGNRTPRPARLEQSAFEGHRRTRVAQSRFDDEMIIRQVRQLFAHQLLHAGTGGHVDVVGAGNRCDPRHRLLQHGPLASHGVELLGSGLAAVWPQPRTDAAGADDKLQHPGAATRKRSSAAGTTVLSRPAGIRAVRPRISSTPEKCPFTAMPVTAAKASNVVSIGVSAPCRVRVNSSASTSTVPPGAGGGAKSGLAIQAMDRARLAGAEIINFSKIVR